MHRDHLDPSKFYVAFHLVNRKQCAWIVSAAKADPAKSAPSEALIYYGRDSSRQESVTGLKDQLMRTCPSSCNELQGYASSSNGVLLEAPPQISWPSNNSAAINESEEVNGALLHDEQITRGDENMNGDGGDKLYVNAGMSALKCMCSSVLLLCSITALLLLLPLVLPGPLPPPPLEVLLLPLFILLLLMCLALSPTLTPPSPALPRPFSSSSSNPI